VERVLGFKPEERIGAKGFELVHPDDMKFLADSFNTLARDTNAPVIKGEMHLRHKDGSWRTLEAVGSNLVRNNVVESIIVNYRDITDRKRVEEELKESEKKYRLLADNVKDVIFVLDMNLNYTYVSPSVKILRGYEPEEVLKQSSIDQTLTPSSMDLAMKALSEVMELEKLEHKEDNISRTLPLEMRRKDGTTVWTETKVSFIRDKDQQPVGILGVTRDITERKQAADALLESEERYRLITENTADTIAVFDLNLNITTYVSPVIRNLRGYTVQEAMTQTLNQMLTPDSLEQASKMFADQMVLESSGTADPARTSLIELEEYCKDGSTIWVEVAASFLRDNNFKPTGILTLTRNITDRKRAEERLKETLDSLRKAFGTTIQVMVSAVEMRDPYTSGHQIRSADLARAIATEMGLPQDKVDGIRMAGIIHDIGKLSIPAEILSKPTKLSEIEFSLIKVHSQSGYEMLKDVESPWPLAEIVYQHHERMNGSGYPRNLKEDEILMESRILAVADVVEAMASHRPYRPTLGIEAAIEEIEKNKGILYDNAVVDACLKLFREKGYQLNEIKKPIP
jgi:PAS domain S-box-containing protein